MPSARLAVIFSIRFSPPEQARDMRGRVAAGLLERGGGGLGGTRILAGCIQPSATSG